MFPMIKIHQRSGDKRYFEKLVKWIRRKFWVLKKLVRFQYFST